MLSLPRAQVQSLVQELRSHKPHSQKKEKKGITFLKRPMFGITSSTLSRLFKVKQRDHRGREEALGWMSEVPEHSFKGWGEGHREAAAAEADGVGRSGEVEAWEGQREDAAEKTRRIWKLGRGFQRWPRVHPESSGLGNL